MGSLCPTSLMSATLPHNPHEFDSLGPTAPNNSDFYRWDIETLKDLFGHAIKKLEQRGLPCFIDCLDECEEDQVRDMMAFFAHLGHLRVSSRFRLHVCFSNATTHI